MLERPTFLVALGTLGATVVSGALLLVAIESYFGFRVEDVL